MDCAAAKGECRGGTNDASAPGIAMEAPKPPHGNTLRTPTETLAAAPTENHTDASKETPKETLMDTPKDTPKESLMDTPKDTPKETPTALDWSTHNAPQSVHGSVEHASTVVGMGRGVSRGVGGEGGGGRGNVAGAGGGAGSTVALAPCGHVCVCATCATKRKICPWCAVKVTGHLRIFLS